MWWEVIAELAYKMALDCGQAHDFFDMVDELSKHNASQQKISSQTAMSTLLGHDWRNHRKRGRDPIRRISHFNGLLDGSNNEKEDRPESVLVKRSKHSQEPTIDIIRHRSLSPISILRNAPVDLEDQRSLSPRTSPLPIKKPEKIRQSKLLQKETLGLPQQEPTSSLPQQKATLRKIAGESPPFKIKSPEKNQATIHFSDLSQNERKQLKEEAQIDEKKPIKPIVRTGKLGMAEKKQKPKKRRSSTTKKSTKEYVVNRLKGVKANDNGELVYLVEWDGDWDDTWEPYHFVAHLEDDVEQVYNKASSDVQAAMRMAGHIVPVD